MDTPLIRDAIRQIQDLVAEATGQMLQGDAERRLSAVLEGFRSGPDGKGEAAERNFSDREVTILIADLRGFAAISATYPASTVLAVLNRCFSRMSEIIVRHYGSIDKFMGDAIMVVFSGDLSEPRSHVRRALLCALEMQIAMNELRTRHRSESVPELYMGIGINTGWVVAGLIGSEVYRAYTVIGEEVNLTSRIEAFSLRGQVLISDSTYGHAADFAQVGEPLEVYVKGKPDKVRIREVIGIPSLGKEVPRQEIRRSPRVEVRLPFRYQRLRGKEVIAEVQRGVIRDIGYHGLLAEFEQPLELYAELKLSVELLQVSHEAKDVYARVVKIVPQQGAHRAAHLAGLEFTSLSAVDDGKIQMFVQMALQGEERS
ncbi:MAG TPA: adenylate/guanylate cyclase domain-containing protein [Burkholderiales bacterium]|nr:adenylate/guanylate cyclase domain-containing protein [Burkholderiales bacterium]